MRGRLALVLAATILFATATASAARVALFQPPLDSPVLVEVASRVYGELTAAGFEVVSVAAAGDADPRGALARLVRDTDAVAAFWVRAVGEGGRRVRAAEVWVLDRDSGRTLVAPIEAAADGEQPAATLALKTVEALRALLADRWLDARAPRAAPAAHVTSAPAPAAATRLSIEAGGALMAPGGGAIGALFTPVVRLGVEAGRVHLRLSAAGGGTSASVRDEAGQASLRVAVMTGDVVLPFRRGRAVMPFLSLGGGVQRLAITGTAAVPYRGHAGAVWSGVAAAGAGAAWAISPSLRLCLGAEVVQVFPATVVRIAGAEAVRLRAPGGVVSVGVRGLL